MTNQIKNKKPNFKRQDSHKQIRLGSHGKDVKWRAAKGRHSKIRLNKKSKPKQPKIGYGNRNEFKNKIKNHVPVRVFNIADLSKITKNQGIIIASVGKRNKNQIIEHANKMKITILNKYRENAK
jgi:large subunit ribosomal protein L32e